MSLDNDNTCQKFPKKEGFEDPVRKTFRLLELYSGIGGMRFAMEIADIPNEVIAAVDINPVVNDIYRHNFGSQGHSQKNILSFTISEIENMNLDIITMSPPCQPFTRVGLKKDIEDARTSSFLYFLNVIKRLQRKPLYLLLENVQGFENSDVRNVLIQTIEESGYRYQEFLLSPQEFGIPNSRLRYYLIAKLKYASFSFVESQQLLREIPNAKSCRKFCCPNCSIIKKTDEDKKCLLKHFLEEKPTEYFEPYLVPDDVLLKYWSVFDIVYEDSCHSCCFTKAYHRYAQGTGSILASYEPTKAPAVFKLLKETEDSKTQLSLLKQLKLRYFTPKEISNLMCFPFYFGFPPNISVRQMYKSLGNSLNVFVVSCLMQLLFER